MIKRFKNNNSGRIRQNQRDADLRPQQLNTVVTLPALGDIVFQWDLFDGVTTPQVGSISYTRSGTVAVPTSQYGWTKFTANQVPVGVVQPETNIPLSGSYFPGAITNYCLQSEDFGTTWTTVGTGSVTTNTADGPFVGATGDADTISGSSAGDGVTQTIAIAAASSTFVFSVWLKATSGTPTVRLNLFDATGTEGTFGEYTLTTNWIRYEVPFTFTASASGNVMVQIIVGNTSTVRAIGAQLEEFTASSTGRRNRYAAANYYVPTTTGSAQCGTVRAAIPNAIAATLTTQGTFSCWINSYQGALDTSVTGPYLLSLNGEEFAILQNYNSGPTLWINSSIMATSVNTTRDVVDTNKWQLLTVTWNTDTDAYKIYLNGELSITGSGTTTAWDAGALNLYLGSYYTTTAQFASDATMAQVVLWDVELDATQVAQIYQVKQAAAQVTYSTDLLFSADLGTSPMPIVGSPHYYWNPKGSSNNWVYPDSNTSVSLIDRATYPIAFPLNGYNKGGFYPGARTTNHCLQSQDFTTTWAAVGSTTVTANAANAPDGNATADQIEGFASGEGVTQSIALTAASRQMVFSVYYTRTAGSNHPSIRIEDGTNSQGTTLAITPTVSDGVWERFSVYHSFSGAASGNCVARIIVNDTDTDGGVYYFWGAQVEQVSTGAGPNAYQNKATTYIPTTTAAVTTAISALTYKAVNNINFEKGTAIVWAFNELSETNTISPQGPSLISAPGHEANNFYTHWLTSSVRFDYGDINTSDTDSRTANTWYMYAFTWDNTGANAILKIYLNGVEIASKNDAAAKTPPISKLMIGGDYVYSAVDLWQGGIDKIRVYGEAKNATFILDFFDDTKADYGY